MSFTLRDKICINYFCSRCPLSKWENPFRKKCFDMNESEIIESIRDGKLKGIKHGRCDHQPCEECEKKHSDKNSTSERVDIERVD